VLIRSLSICLLSEKIGQNQPGGHGDKSNRPESVIRALEKSICRPPHFIRKGEVRKPLDKKDEPYQE